MVLLSLAAVVASAYWAYNENYQTQARLREVAELQRQIAREREAIAVLGAEWAYLNRPERLRELVELNFSELQLIPLLPEHFADIEMVAYPPEPAPEPGERLEEGAGGIPPEEIEGTVRVMEAARPAPGPDKEFP